MHVAKRVQRVGTTARMKAKIKAGPFSSGALLGGTGHIAALPGDARKSP